MHIVDGALSMPVLIGGGIATAAGVAYGLRKMTSDDLPKVAVMSAAFFVASLVRVPVGVSTVHLLLNGLSGVMLGWMAFPAIFIALLLQAVFFGFGGITVLGINTLNVALPAIIAYLLFKTCAHGGDRKKLVVLGFIAGVLGVMLTSVGVGTALALTGEEFLETAWFVFLSHTPVMVVEGFVTAMTIGFLHKVKPELLNRCLPTKSSPAPTSVPNVAPETTPNA